MAVSKIICIIQADINIVWNTVTSLENNSRRTALRKIEVKNENQLIEYTK